LLCQKVDLLAPCFVHPRVRVYVTDFIRDARAGGRAAGTPPDNLGFRLVRDQPSFVARTAELFGRTFFARG
jgi:hypothetical protein